MNLPTFFGNIFMPNFCQFDAPIASVGKTTFGLFIKYQNFEQKL